MNEIALVCANFGSFDNIKPLPPHPGIDAFYYHDGKATDPRLKGKLDGWDHYIVPNYPRYDFNDRLRARYFKHQIHRLDETQGYKYLVWMDGGVVIKRPEVFNVWAEKLQDRSEEDKMMFVPHPVRLTPQDEFNYIHGSVLAGEPYLTARYATEKMPEMMDWMAAHDWNVKTRLVNGTIWMVGVNPWIRHTWDDWWDMNLRFGMMDQLSLPPLLYQNLHTPLYFNVNVWDNPWWTISAHASPQETPDVLALP